jgi:phosphate/sulfate permease
MFAHVERAGELAEGIRDVEHKGDITHDTIARLHKTKGSVGKFSAIRWGVAGRIVWAWVRTVPGSAGISAAAYELAVSAGIAP